MPSAELDSPDALLPASLCVDYFIVPPNVPLCGFAKNYFDPADPLYNQAEELPYVVTYDVSQEDSLRMAFYGNVGGFKGILFSWELQ